MPWLWLALELAVEQLAAWTVAVHGAMALGLAAGWAWPLWALLGGALAFRGRERFAAARAAEPAERRFALGALAVAAVASLPALVLLTPSGDDFNFFHRVLWQLGHLGEPFARGDTAYGVAGLPAISPLHVLTTWELGLGMTAHALGLDPLGVYHNGAVVLANALLVTVFALWLRELGFRPGAALVGVVGVVVFFYADDPAVRSWAIAYRMLWVGKMVQWLVVLPAALLFAWRYLREPSVRHLLHPVACGVAAVATSGTGVFLLPGVFAAASLAGLTLRPAGDAALGPRRIAECAALNLGSAYCFGVAGLVLFGGWSQPQDVRAWVDSFPGEWTENLQLVMPHAAAWLRNGVLAFVVPLVLLRGDGRRFLPGFGLALVALFLNPVSGPLWLEAVQPGSFWRVALLFPVPLGVGLVAASLCGSWRPQAVVWGVAAVVVALLVSARGTPPPAFAYMQHRYAFKSPLALRLAPGEVALLQRAGADLAGRRLLAARGVSTTVGLLVPSARLEASRLQDTRHVFANAGDPAEGLRRIRAWEWASRCDWPRSAEAAAARSIEQGVDAVLAVDCGPDDAVRRAPVLRRAGARFQEVARESGLVLYLRR